MIETSVTLALEFPYIERCRILRPHPTQVPCLMPSLNPPEIHKSRWKVTELIKSTAVNKMRMNDIMVNANLFCVISKPVMNVIMRRAIFGENCLFPQTCKILDISYYLLLHLSPELFFRFKRIIKKINKHWGISYIQNYVCTSGIEFSMVWLWH